MQFSQFTPWQKSISIIDGYGRHTIIGIHSMTEILVSDDQSLKTVLIAPITEHKYVLTCEEQKISTMA